MLRPILFHLPADVAISILMDWLGDIKSLVALDSASARSIRWAYLGLVRDPAFVMVTVKMVRKVTDICCWIKSRGVRVREIVVLSPLVKEVVGLSRECLSVVTSLTVSSIHGKSADLEDVRDLLNLVPSLTSLDVSGFLGQNDDYMDILATMDHLRLRVLKLDYRGALCERIELLTGVFSSTLEVLHVGGGRWIKAATLYQLGATCRNLKELRFTCYDVLVTFEILASALGPGKFPLLQKIITTTGPVFNDEVALALCSSHPNLQSIHVQGGASMTFSSITTALTHCPGFEELNTASFRFTTVFAAKNSAELPYYKLVTQYTSVSNWRDDLEAITRAPFFKYRVRVFQSSETDRFYSNEDVGSIIDVFGQDLHVLEIMLGDSFSRQTLERIFRECTELRTLSFKYCTIFTDVLLMVLADQCQQITSLSLVGGINITDVGMCYLLQRMSQRLKCLRVEQCALYEPTLVTIVECCAQMEVLDITDTGLTADFVVAHVIMPDRLKNLQQLTVEPEALESYRKFVWEKENEVNERWRKIFEQ